MGTSQDTSATLDYLYSGPAAGAKCVDDAQAENWYEKLREEVDFHCLLCEGLHMEISELETKVKEAYVTTARSMKGLHDVTEIANRWFGMRAFASEILAIAKNTTDAHQICGADTTGIEKYHNAALERYNLHCPSVTSA